MIAVITVLVAFPVGYFLRSRLAANTTYAIAYLWGFVYQSTYLLLDSLGGGENPAFTVGDFPWAYGLVALAIFTAGFGLVNLGHWVRARRASRTEGSYATTAPTYAVDG